MKTRIGIIGYGNLGRGVEAAAAMCDDMELKAVFTRRDPKSVKTVSGVPVFDSAKVTEFGDDIDVMIICGGSATDLPKQTPYYSQFFNTIDSFDTHARIPEHFAAVDEACRKNGTVSVISVGWDPGMFSLNRAYAEAIIPDGSTYTFWGRGVSQGHSDAVRRIKGVMDARQYTIPVQSAVDMVRSGQTPVLTAGQKHTRECFVVAEEGADKNAIEKEIKTMPNYFADYETTVHFITAEEMKRDHSAMPHGGSVIRTGRTGSGDKHVIEYKLTLESNPEFTSSVLVAYARAAHRLSLEGQAGCKTVFDIAPSYLYPGTPDELRNHLL